MNIPNFHVTYWVIEYCDFESTDPVYFHHKIVLMIVVIQNFQLEVVNKLKYVGDTGPDPEEEEDGAGPRGQCGRRHQP